MFFLVGFATDDIYVVADFMDLPESEDENLETSLFHLGSWEKFVEMRLKHHVIRNTKRAMLATFATASVSVAGFATTWTMPVSTVQQFAAYCVSLN
jgi:hypothetical protein